MTLNFNNMAMRWMILILLSMLLSACQCLPAPLDSDNKAKIDQLLTLMNERLALAPKVAKAKWNSGAAIDDKVREAQILAKVKQKAVLLGLNPDIAHDFFAAQIEANKLYQRQLHEQWRRKALPAFKDAPDLARDVRPVIDELQTKLLRALSDIQPLNLDASMRTYLQRRAEQLISGNFNNEVRAMAIHPLIRQ